MIHGDCVSIGCYAMTNQGIDEIFQPLPVRWYLVSRACK